mmetsp:Transcript_30047/g.75643  ORF Transcript_30047/g.75643 Transcript_30047/m.75643 type:complete len:287 (+) Transcript_30047:16-876(+)
MPGGHIATKIKPRPFPLILLDRWLFGCDVKVYGLTRNMGSNDDGSSLKQIRKTHVHVGAVSLAGGNHRTSIQNICQLNWRFYFYFSVAFNLLEQLPLPARVKEQKVFPTLLIEALIPKQHLCHILLPIPDIVCVYWTRHRYPRKTRCIPNDEQGCFISILGSKGVGTQSSEEKELGEVFPLPDLELRVNAFPAVPVGHPPVLSEALLRLPHVKQALLQQIELEHLIHLFVQEFNIRAHPVPCPRPIIVGPLVDRVLLVGDPNPVQRPRQRRVCLVLHGPSLRPRDV